MSGAALGLRIVGPLFRKKSKPGQRHGSRHSGEGMVRVVRFPVPAGSWRRRMAREDLEYPRPKWAILLQAQGQGWLR